MDKISVLKGLYQAHLSESSDEEDAKQQLAEIFTEKIELYVRSRIPNAVFDGEISDLLFDDSDSEWYNIESNTEIGADGGPYEFRVLEVLGKNSCEVCRFIHGKVLPIELMESGVTAPPFHPNCQGRVEVLDRDGNVLFVIGRDKTGGTSGFLNGIQAVLDILGLFSSLAAGLNAIISLLRSDNTAAASEVDSMFPFAVWTKKGAEWLKKIIEYGSLVDDIIGFAEEHGGEIWDAIKSALDAAIEIGGGVPDTISDIIDSFTEFGESLLDFLDNLIGGGDEADTNGDMVGGKIPVDEYNDIRGSSVKNPDSDTLTLGSYGDGGADSYTARAGETSYFDMGADWNRVQDKYDLSDDEMFKYFNLPILDEATKGGKTIRFSHNPIGDKGFLGMEWEYIKSSLGISDVDLVFEGGFWYVK